MSVVRLTYRDHHWYGFVDGFEEEDQILRGTRTLVNHQPVWDLRYKVPFPPAEEYSVPLEFTLNSEAYYDYQYVLDVDFA